MNHSELLAEWKRVSRLVHTAQSPYTVATMLNAAATTRRQLAHYIGVEKMSGMRPERATIFAETRRTLELEARWYIAEARNIRKSVTPTRQQSKALTKKPLGLSFCPKPHLT